MFCPNCGKEVNESKFCSGCGTPVVRETENVNVEKVVTKKKASKSTAKSIIFVVIAIGAGLLCLLFRQDKSEKFLAMLKAGQYTEASAYYQSDLTGDEKELKKVYETVVTEINGLVESYYANNMSYDDAKNGLKTYSNFYSTETNSALQNIEKLKDSKDAFVQAEEDFASEEYRTAYDLYAQVIEEDSNYSTAQEKHEVCYEIIRDQIELSSGKTCSEGSFIKAANILEAEMDFFNEADKEFFGKKMEEYREIYLTSNMTIFEDYLSAGNYDECFQLLDTVAAESGSSDTLTQATNNLHTAYEGYITEQVNVYLESRDLDSAFQLVNQAMMQMPNNEKLNTVKENIIQYYPIKLQDIHVFEENLPGTRNTVSNVKDSYQNDYETGILYYDTSYQDASDGFEYKERQEVYLLNKEYEHFTATITPSEKWKREGLGEKYGTAVFTIYGDGVKLFSTSVWKTSKPVNIDIDVTGIEKLQIGFYRGHEGYFLLADPYLYKKY